MNFGGGGYNAYQNSGPAESSLKMRVNPANVSGPDHLRVLHGKCYTWVTSEYKYEFCPFFNLTQHEQSLRWNPYSGVLGVWQEWEVENNTFVAMLLNEGDKCGSVSRSARVVLKCGNRTHIRNVTEPNKCHYEVDFVTPLVCHPHSRLVYPTLSTALQHEWDLLETQYQYGEITSAGYKAFLRTRVLEKAGLCLDDSARQTLSEQAKQLDEVKARHDKGEFDTLEQCTEELKKAKERVKELTEALQANGVNPDSGVNRHDEEADAMGDEMPDHYRDPDHYYDEDSMGM